SIGKRGQNVRLATRLVGWNIDIVSEDVLKKEIAQKMGKMMASGEAVPIAALEGVTANQAESLSAKGIETVDQLAAASVDNIVDFLDVSLDEAESIIGIAASIVAARNAEAETAAAETAEAADEAGSEPSADAPAETDAEAAGEASVEPDAAPEGEVVTPAETASEDALPETGGENDAVAESTESAEAESSEAEPAETAEAGEADTAEASEIPADTENFEPASTDEVAGAENDTDDEQAI